MLVSRMRGSVLSFSNPEPQPHPLPDPRFRAGITMIGAVTMGGKNQPAFVAALQEGQFGMKAKFKSAEIAAWFPCSISGYAHREDFAFRGTIIGALTIESGGGASKGGATVTAKNPGIALWQKHGVKYSALVVSAQLKTSFFDLEMQKMGITMSRNGMAMSGTAMLRGNIENCVLKVPCCMP